MRKLYGSIALVAILSIVVSLAYTEVKQTGYDECTVAQAALNKQATGDAAAELSTELETTLAQVDKENVKASQTAAKLAHVNVTTQVDNADREAVKVASADYRLGPDFVRVFNKAVGSPPGSGPAENS